MPPPVVEPAGTRLKKIQPAATIRTKTENSENDREPTPFMSFQVYHRRFWGRRRMSYNGGLRGRVMIFTREKRNRIVSVLPAIIFVLALILSACRKAPDLSGTPQLTSTAVATSPVVDTEPPIVTAIPEEPTAEATVEDEYPPPINGPTLTAIAYPWPPTESSRYPAPVDGSQPGEVTPYPGPGGAPGQQPTASAYPGPGEGQATPTSGGPPAPSRTPFPNTLTPFAPVTPPTGGAPTETLPVPPTSNIPTGFPSSSPTPTPRYATPTPVSGGAVTSMPGITPSATALPTQALLPTMPQTPVSERLRATDPRLVKLASGKIQLVEFFAFWCGTCKAMATTVHTLEALYGERVNFVYLDIDDPATRPFKTELLYRYQPEFFLLNPEGKVLKHWREYVTREDLESAIQAALQAYFPLPTATPSPTPRPTP